MTWFWCQKHRQAHTLRSTNSGLDCLLVGPYSTKTEAENFATPAKALEAKARRRGQREARQALKEF